MLLNCVLPPAKVTANFKPSILRAQEDVIIFAASDEDARQKLDNFNEMYTDLGFEIVPKLVFRGEGILSLSGQFEMHYKDIVYSLPSAKRAVDVLIKLITVFGLKHSKISRFAWQFIRSAYYKVPGEAAYSTILRLRRELNL